jgi:hypothetical protein
MLERLFSSLLYDNFNSIMITLIYINLMQNGRVFSSSLNENFNSIMITLIYFNLMQNDRNY